MQIKTRKTAKDLGKKDTDGDKYKSIYIYSKMRSTVLGHPHQKKKRKNNEKLNHFLSIATNFSSIA